MPRIDRNQVTLRVLHQFEGVAVFAAWVGGRGEPNGASRLGAAEHGAGVGAMHRDPTGGRFDVRQETLIAANQHARKQTRLEFNGRSPSPGRA